ncbi:MFS transporter [Kitasatospora indigofera]|uniref:MFS transporter n=1 Tax=Kitasatospora indigofera TaxID=67307 RepID=A0A919KU77_9ACTN|nr:MFS transporter [Kitasatospora indigofera]GHH72688.1 MFS transporter [Kitasatospora indigofera]
MASSQLKTGSRADATAAGGFRAVAPVLALCWLSVFFDGMDVNIYGAVMPYMLKDHGLGLTTGVAGTIGSWTTFGMLIGALVAGSVTDWLGRRPLLTVSVLLFSTGSAVCALANGVTMFGAGRFLAGLGLGGLMPLCLAMVMEFAPKGKVALATGVLMTSYHSGGMAATGLGLSIAPSHGWRWVFAAGAAPALVAVPLLLRFLPESPAALLAGGRRAAADAVADRYGLARPVAPEERATGARGRWESILALFGPGFRWATPLLWAASFCGLLLVYGVSTWLPQLMRASGYGLTDSVTFLLVVNAGGIVGMLFAGRIADRFGPARISGLFFAFTAVGVLLLNSHLPLAATYVMVGVTGVWLFSAQTMVYAAANAIYSSDKRATGLGWVTGVGRFGAVVGPSLAGSLVAGGRQDLGFTAFAVAGVLGAVLVTLAQFAARIGARRPVVAAAV